jgi:mono/diheme cytochrome c family protein
MRIWLLLFTSLLINLHIASTQESRESINMEKLSRMSGKEIYDMFCSKCHGLDGRGNIPDEIKNNLEAPPPDFTDEYFNSREKRRDWFAVIKYGGGVRGLSMSMPAFGEAFSDEQIMEVIEHIKSFVDQDKYPQGELNFIRAHYVTKAFPEQEALLIPTHTHRQERNKKINDMKLVLYYANRFGNRFQYEIKLPVYNIYSTDENITGIGDIEIGLKYAFYDNYRTLTITTTGFEISIPIGKKGLSRGSPLLTPYFTVAKGIGEKIQLQGSVKIESTVDKPGDSELIYAFSTSLILPEGKKGFFPGVELVGRKHLSKVEHIISLVPKIYISFTKRGHIAFSIGTEIPIYGDKPFKYRFVAFLLWDYVDGGLFW